MPITRKQFELGINSETEVWMRKIYAFLVEHRDRAYTRLELGDSLELELRPPAAGSDEGRLFDAGLNKLVGLDCVQAREVGGTLYFGEGRHDLEKVLSGEVSPFPF
jgi:hypothetical protein